MLLKRFVCLNYLLLTGEKSNFAYLKIDLGANRPPASCFSFSVHIYVELLCLYPSDCVVHYQSVAAQESTTPGQKSEQ